jgi:hypothetical protein
MKKIALIGNCQLQQIGHFLTHLVDHSLLQVTWYLPPFIMASGHSLVDFYNALEQSDIVFGHFHSERWGDLSTNALGKYFDLTLVPTLESPCSSPQINYFEKNNKYDLYDIDFRILELYLQGKLWHEASALYHDKKINYAKLLEQTQAQIDKYHTNFEKGQLASDYSSFYLSELASFGPKIYQTHNHPNNRHLQWLMDEITSIAIGLQFKTLENLPMILGDTIAPALGSEDRNYTLKGKSIGLDLAVKIYYATFDSMDKAYLEEQFSIGRYASIAA